MPENNDKDNDNEEIEENKMTETDPNQDQEGKQVKSPSGAYFWKWTNDLIVISGWLFYLIILYRNGENLPYTLVLILILSVLGVKVYKKLKE